MGSEEERERLKEEYKAHYREIKQLKQKLAEAERLGKIKKAMQNIDPAGLMESFDESLHKLQQTALEAEARLEMALDAHRTEMDAEEAHERTQKQKASELLEQLRQETPAAKKNSLDQSEVVKTIGRKKEDP
jgi:predicted phage tail protein